MLPSPTPGAKCSPARAIASPAASTAGSAAFTCTDAATCGGTTRCGVALCDRRVDCRGHLNDDVPVPRRMVALSLALALALGLGLAGVALVYAARHPLPLTQPPPRMPTAFARFVYAYLD